MPELIKLLCVVTLRDDFFTEVVLLLLYWHYNCKYYIFQIGNNVNAFKICLLIYILFSLISFIYYIWFLKQRNLLYWELFSSALLKNYKKFRNNWDKRARKLKKVKKIKHIENSVQAKKNFHLFSVCVHRLHNKLDIKDKQAFALFKFHHHCDALETIASP